MNMKKILIHYLFHVLLIFTIVFSFYCRETFCAGDLNFDGKIDIRDLNLLQTYIMERDGFNTIGDQNKDGKIDVIDLQILLNKITKSWGEQRDFTPFAYITIHPPNPVSDKISKVILSPRSVFSYCHNTKFFCPSNLSQLVLPRDVLADFLMGHTEHAPPVV